jgi:hypothetical protein
MIGGSQVREFFERSILVMAYRTMSWFRGFSFNLGFTLRAASTCKTKQVTETSLGSTVLAKGEYNYMPIILASMEAKEHTQKEQKTAKIHPLSYTLIFINMKLSF